ncbi:MAG: HAD-IA family hydrolase [Duncaniella sp.]|nr:HAD-IA family hydrolase [Duncaniella sp.]MDE5752186.1 HAD-IA family hydrolase [Duncaniella sp.]MDE5919440.1 HAD-IA family hydrolase [Duncaniella sp.]MDE6170755.1 HAD-IA family hydrolase [Duncaniella sp.]MDE6358187.1 HAD-IA family hydrolase [Duncaniella sp.]
MNLHIPYATDILRFLHRHHYTSVVPKAALIDMDGTLYDSMKNHTAAWYRLISELGIPCTREEFYLYEGRTGTATINLLFNRHLGHEADPEEALRLYKRKTEYFAELPRVEPMAGAQEMTRILRDAGITRVLVTGSGQSSVISRLNEDYPGIFADDLRVTSHNVTHGKPHPEPFIKAMQMARVSPSQCIVVENAPLGVEAGDRAGAFTIGVTTGPIPPAALEEAGAAVVFPSMPAFAQALPTLLLSLLTVHDIPS